MSNHYQVLNLSITADLAAIRKAYLKISLLHHPDKTIHVSASERSQREHLFKLANDAGAVRRALLNSRRFTTTTLGTPPDYHWSFSEVVEEMDCTTFSFSNWLGWKFSIGISNHFNLAGRPTLPETQQPESIQVRLPLQRVPEQATRVPTDMSMDLRSTPDSKHTVLYSTLIETPEGLELHVEVTIVAKGKPEDVERPVPWKWMFAIDHEPLLAGMKIKVTNHIFHPVKPSFATLPNGGMPAPPYPHGSPMLALVAKYPGILIEHSAPDTYCKKEEQLSKCFWRLSAVGSM
ncbi:hypothetical protein EJ07DRAFT_123025 [Lizonia empirigonia]|nr:hypothetical protein EJ07DRAFT_123025 [Lizonia empirigonia]